MGLLDIFTVDKEKRQAKAIRKATDRLTNKYRQSPERTAAAQTLQGIGTADAIYGLLKRFTVASSNGVEDQDEKEYVYHMVLELGEKAVPAIERFLENEVQLFWPLKALSNMVPEDRMVQIIGQVLQSIGPDYVRNPERKLHLVQHLADYNNPQVVDILLPFVQDHDETIRFQVINALSSHEDERVRDALLQLLTDEDEDSLRIRNRILDIMVERHWTVKGFRKRVEELLPSGFVLDRDGHVLRVG